MVNITTMPKLKKDIYKKPSLYIDSDSIKSTSPPIDGTDINFAITVPSKFENASDSINIPIINPRKCFGASKVVLDCTNGPMQSSPKLIKEIAITKYKYPTLPLLSAFTQPI